MFAVVALQVLGAPLPGTTALVAGITWLVASLTVLRRHASRRMRTASALVDAK